MGFFGSLRTFIATHPDSTIDAYTYGDFDLHWWGENSVHIGKFCSIGGNAKLYLGGNHKINNVTSYPFSNAHGLDASEIGVDGLLTNTSKGNIIVGSDVWFGDNCVIMSGVTIGHGAVIANSAIVTKDVPPYAIVGGNPAKIIKYRFSEEIIKDLLEIQWWNWSFDKLNSMKPYIYNTDINQFIRMCKG